MAQAPTSPARALARLMVAAFAAVLMLLCLSVGAIGIADPGDPGAVTTPAAAAP